ncbi:MAG: efflux transporter outer membrane subunit [Sulfuricurvum sp.]
MKTFNFLSLSLVLVLSSGCVPKVEKASPVPESRIDGELDALSAEFSDGTLEREWWKRYHDAQLDSILGEALASAPAIQTVRARYAQAGALIESVEAYNLPHVSANTSLVKERFSANHIFPKTFLGGSTNTEYQAGISLDYDFDFWDKRKSRILSAKEQAMAQMASIEASKVALSTAIVQTYLSWNYDERQRDVLRSIEQTASEELSITDKRRRLGLSDATATYRAKAVLASIGERIAAVDKKIEGEKESICVLGGFLPSYAQTLKKPDIAEASPLPLPKEVMLHLLSHRPDVAVAKHTALSKSHTIEEAKARFYPDISLSGLIGFISFDWAKFLDHSSYQPSGGIAASLPLLDWGEREAVLNGSVGDYNASVYEYNQAVISAANEVVVVLKQSHIVQSQVQIHARQMEAKRSETAIAQHKYKLALVNKLPYLAARRNEYETLGEAIDLERDQSLLQVSLIRSLGGGYRQKDPK